ncbi:MAG: YajQ family cyclic di-GMP-binding protein [Ottowia sp.]|nr:YajQ family cyclic di-GMP-binding protein [Ottowia sp.]
MPSFDVVCTPNMPEVKNAVTNTQRNLGLRFDFKGTSAAVELEDNEITLVADSAFQLAQVEDVLRHKLAKRGVDARFLNLGAVQTSGRGVRQVATLTNGLEADSARKIQKLVKESKLKLQAAVQGDTVRISGAKKDALQEAMALLREKMSELPLSFENYRN